MATCIEIDHSRGVVTRYGHLSRFAKGMRVGKRVEQGTVIAFVGMSGLATGPASALRIPGQRRLQESADRQARGSDADRSEMAGGFPQRSRLPLLATLEIPLGPALVAR